MVYLASFLLALFVTMALVPVFRRVAGAMGAVDEPCARKVHLRPMPKTGGLALAAGAFVPVLLWAPRTPAFTSVLLGAGVIVCFGFLDDIRDLGYRAKFVGQLGASVLVVGFGGIRIASVGTLLPDGMALSSVLGVPLTVVAVLGVTNAINLADGLDGLAGGVTVLSFGGLGVLAYQAGQPPVAMVCAATGGAILGFLRYNTHPATVFMGDAGSQLLGFLLVTLALLLTQTNEPLSPTLPLFIVGIPVLDTLLVMGERVGTGRSPFAADRNHLHHKLMALGLYHPDAVRVIYLLQGGLVATALVLRYEADGVLLAVYATLAAAVVGGVLGLTRAGWRIERYWAPLMVGKKWTRRVAASGVVVRAAYRLLLLALPVLAVGSCWMPAEVTWTQGFGAAVLVVVLMGLVVGGFGPWAAQVARLAMYLLTPFVLFQMEMAPAHWLEQGGLRLYSLAVVALVGVALVVVRFSRRRGFRTTPTDLLILTAAVVLPFVSGQSQHTGTVAAKVLAVFFVIEVALREQRGELRGFKATTLAALLVTAVRGLGG